MKRTMSTKHLTSMALLAAVAFLVVVFIRIPIFPAAPFLKLDVKDVVITIGGFLFGPFSALLISLVVSFVEMITVSDSGIIGFIMNVLASCAFACTAALIYSKMRTQKGAILGLFAGTLAMTAVMVLWNYLITPLYMAATRAQIAGMILPIFLPFNLIKGAVNSIATMLLYKPVVMALRRANLAPESQNATSSQGKIKWGVMLVCALALISLIGLILVLQQG